MKILFVFTGGTIGSTVGENYICVDERKPYLLIEKYRECYGIDFEYDAISPYTALSENSDGRILSLLVNCLIANKDKGYDGMIVTHGTDTLQYSAALCSYIMGKSIPLCLVSSAYPIEDKRQNGIDNLHAAVKLIEKGYKGVYVPYRNIDGVIYIHKGEKLLASEAFSADFRSLEDDYFARLVGDEILFRAVRNLPFTDRENGRGKSGSAEQDFHKSMWKLQEMQALNLDKSCNSILWIKPYPGMAYPKIPKETKYILHETYHSGTFHADTDEAKAFFAEAYVRRIPVYLTGISEGISYESTRIYEECHLIPLYHTAPIAAFMGLWLLAAE
jgi:L-asparaginase